MATSEEIDKIIESTDMVELVSPYVSLTKQGKSYKGLCPFHDEKTPSFVVSQEKHLAHCFGCGKGGNPIQFLMDIKQIPFQEALAELAKKNGIAIALQPKKQGKDYTKYYEMLELATKFYAQNLNFTKSGKVALEYLKKRGLDEPTIKAFDIGLAPKNIDSLYKVLKEAHYLELDMLDLGLIGKNDRGYYDIFMNRITFPIKDEQGHVIGFSARILEEDPNQPKYINTKETFLYHKANVLYHLDAAKSEILRKKRVILHEGQMDVIATTRAGLKECICTMGTALSYEQALVLKKYSSDAILCYDGDKAGIKASKKAIRILKKAGLRVHLVLLPNGMDPDEFVLTHGIDEYLAYFEGHIIDELEYMFETVFLNRSLKDSVALEEMKLDAFQSIMQMPSQTIKEQFLKKLSLKIDSSLESIISDYNTYCKTDYPVEPVEETDDSLFLPPFVDSVQQPIQRKAREYEVRLFLYARQSKQQAYNIDRKISEYLNAFEAKNRKLWSVLIDEYYATYEVFDDAVFCSLLNDELKEQYLFNLEFIRGKIGVYGDADLNMIINKMKEVYYQVHNRVLTEQIIESDDIIFQTKKLADKFENKKKTMPTRRK